MFQKELDAMIKYGLEAKEIALKFYHEAHLEAEVKDDHSPVTKADKTNDKFLKEKLSHDFPTYAFLTEESQDDKARLDNDYVFIIDPIDGTKDFIAHDDQFTINIALAYRHEPVVGVIIIPARNEYYFAGKGEGSFYVDSEGKKTRIHTNSEKREHLICLTSVFHLNDVEKQLIEKYHHLIDEVRPCGSSIKMCEIARGIADISFRISNNTKEWDTCAGQVILEEAGGALLTLDNKRVLYNREDVYNRGGYLLLNNKKHFLSID